MDMSALLPPLREPSLENFTELLLSAVILSCQEPRFKRLTGLAGLAMCPGSTGWTCKISARPGIYGIVPDSRSQCPHGGLESQWLLYYFPAPDEDILECSLLRAAFAAQAPEYLNMVRNFPAHPDVTALFPAGRLLFGLGAGKSSVTLGLRALASRTTFSPDGVFSPDHSGYIVEPGQAEEEFPELDVASALLTVLASALSFTLSAPPSGEYTGHPLPREKGPETGDSSTAVTRIISWSAAQAFPAWNFVDGWTMHPATENPDAPYRVVHDLGALEQKGLHPEIFDSRPQLLVVSGFLGAGKTTFLNQLIEYHISRNETVAVIQNEIGQTGVDGKILEGGVKAVELDEGCVCCTLAGHLGRGIREILSAYRPGIIVLECTGLANPLNILWEIQELRALVRLDSVTTLLDAADALQLMNDQEIARDQIKAADIVILNKCDLADEKTLRKACEAVRERNAGAAISMARFGDVPFATLYTGEGNNPGMLPSLPKKHGSHQEMGFTSTTLDIPCPVTRTALAQCLDTCPSSVFRLKGIVLTTPADPKEPDETVLVQFTNGRWDLSQLRGDIPEKTFLTAIGQHMDREAVARHLRRVLGF